MVDDEDLDWGFLRFELDSQIAIGFLGPNQPQAIHTSAGRGVSLSGITMGRRLRWR
jgi:hypothetical protein